MTIAKPQSTDSHSISVRRASAQDAPTIARFQSEMAWESEKLRLDTATVNRGVMGVFEEPSRGQYFVAESDGQVVGCLLICYEWSDWRAGTVWWIHSVYVEPSARQKGVFAALYSHIRSLVEADSSLRGLRLYVEKSNTRAQAIYKKIGMTDHHYDLYEWLKA